VTHSNAEEARVSAAMGYLDAETRKRPSLTISTNTQVKSLLFEKQVVEDGRWKDSGQVVDLPARSVMVAAGTSPNVIYEKEHPGTFKLYEKDFPEQDELHCDFIFVSQDLVPRIDSVRVDPQRLRTLGIGLDEIETPLQNWNVNQPTGQLFGPSHTWTISATGQLMNANAFRQMVVAYRNGAPVHLDQVATVIDSVEDTRSASWFFDPDAVRHGELRATARECCEVCWRRQRDRPFA